MEKRKVLLIAGGGVLLVGGYLLYRHHKGAVQSGSAGGYSGLPVLTSTFKDGVGSNGVPILYGSAGSSSGFGGGGVGSNPPQSASLGTGTGIVAPGAPTVTPTVTTVPIGNSSLVTPQTSGGSLAGALTQQEEAVQQQIDLEDTEQNQFAQNVYASAIAQNAQGLIASSQPTTPISTTNPKTGSAVTVVPQAGSTVFGVVSTPPPAQAPTPPPTLSESQEEQLLEQGGFQ